MNKREYLDNVYKSQEEYLGTDKAVNKIIPRVSVSIITYQQCAYIGKAIESVLNQNVNFDYEIIIGEDGSTDGTRELCKKYAEAHPDKIRLFLRDRSKTILKADNGNTLYLNPQLQKLHARGKYYAVCDGDDYWIDKLKLQKQVDFLENYPKIGLVYTNYNVLDQLNGKIISKDQALPDGDMRYELLKQCDIIHSTACYRKCLQDEFLMDIQLNKGFTMGDYPSWLYIAQKYRFHYMRETTTMYRVVQNSATHVGVKSTIKIYQSEFLVKKFYIENFNYKNSSKLTLSYRASFYRKVTILCGVFIARLIIPQSLLNILKRFILKFK